MKQLGIFGTGGCATDLADIADALGYAVCFIARDEAERAAWQGAERVIVEADVEQLDAAGFVIGIGANALRQKLAGRYAGRLAFPNLVHPAASLGRGQAAALARSQGVMVSAGVRLTSNIAVGDFVLFNINATVAHDCIVEHCVTVAPGANVSGNVHLGERVWVGSGAVINQGRARDDKLHIGADSVIGSGAVVLGHCAAGGVYAGVPAQRIK